MNIYRLHENTHYNQQFGRKTLQNRILVEGKKRKISDLVFYKQRWEKTTKKTASSKTKYILEEQIIVTYSRKFAVYQKHIRDKKLEIARKLLKNPGKLTKTNQRDPRYYITETSITKDGEAAMGN